MTQGARVMGGSIMLGIAAVMLAGCVAGSGTAPVPARPGLAHAPPAVDERAGADAPPLAVRAMTLADCLEMAFAHNPGLRSAADRLQAAMAGAAQAGFPDDPALSFEYFVRQTDTRYRVGLTQMLPAWGALRLRRDRAAAEARAAMHAFETERLALYARVARGFFEYHYLERAIRVTGEHHRLLAELEQAMAARYQAGETGFADLIKVQVETARLADRLASLRDQRSARSAGLAALLNLPADTLLPCPRQAPAADVALNEDLLADLLEELNPELRAANARIAAAGADEELARRDGWPRLMLGLGYMAMSGMDGGGDDADIGLMAGITLPVWRTRVRAARRASAAQRRRAEHGLGNMRNLLQAELRTAVYDFRDAGRRIELFANSLLPKAEKSLEVAGQAYAGGQTEFMTLIDAQRLLIEFQLQAERAAVDREIARAEIVRRVGAVDLDTLPGDDL